MTNLRTWKYILGAWTIPQDQMTPLNRLIKDRPCIFTFFQIYINYQATDLTLVHGDCTHGQWPASIPAASQSQPEKGSSAHCTASLTCPAGLDQRFRKDYQVVQPSYQTIDNPCPLSLSKSVKFLFLLPWFKSKPKKSPVVLPPHNHSSSGRLQLQVDRSSTDKGTER